MTNPAKDDEALVDAVAKSIFDAEPNVGHWCDWEDLLDDPEHTANLEFAEVYRRHARAAIAAVRAFDAERGMVLVPREPTEAQLNVGVRAINGSIGGGLPRAACAYRSMIEAAAKPGGDAA